jgi:hypothetical protein
VWMRMTCEIFLEIDMQDVWSQWGRSFLASRTTDTDCRPTATPLSTVVDWHSKIAFFFDTGWALELQAFLDGGSSTLPSTQPLAFSLANNIYGSKYWNDESVSLGNWDLPLPSVRGIASPSVYEYE